MLISWTALAAGAGVGLVVGLTGSGGGALLTPILILLLGVDSKTAVASDLVATLVMRPVAAAAHLRHHTIQWPIVRRLVVGSVPSAFVAGVCSHLLFSSKHATSVLEVIIGVTLIASGGTAVVRRMLRRRSAVDGRDAPAWVTVAIGVVGGFVVGITSVGSGTLMLVGLGICYPTLAPGALVGTDLVQAVPLVGAAALGHLAGGGLHLTLTASVIIGGVPAALVGGVLSGRVPDRPLGAIVAIVILGSGCALVGWIPGSIVGAVAVVAVTAFVLRNRRTASAATASGATASGATASGG